MKFTILILILSVSLVKSLSVRSILDGALSLFHFKGQNETDSHRDCAVHKFPSVDKVDARKLSGDWYEVGRTITKIPIFSSSVWRFDDDEHLDQQAFFFVSRLVNGHCSAPLSGKAISSNINPGTFVLTYDGIKSRVEEELKVIYHNFPHALVLYGCSRLTTNGNCLPEAAFVAVLSKQKVLQTAILNEIYDAIRSVCIDPHTLVTQNTSNACSFEDTETVGWPTEGEFPTCKKTATCTIACPRCCEEDSEGCISCDCESNQNAQLLCKKSVTECDPGCNLREKSPGCQICDCSRVIQRAPEVITSQNLREIQEYIECPTACRTPKLNNKLYCNCTNQEMCQRDKPHINCVGNKEHYSFDHKTGTCPAYLGDCEDNLNSYSSVHECLRSCADICDIHVEKGECDGDSIHWYYNRVLGSCEKFVYGGCGGNENNYETEEECKKRCPAKFQELVEKIKGLDPICKMKEDKGSCTDNVLRYAYIAEADTCVTFPYGGCEGNENNFFTLEACNAKCKIAAAHMKSSSCVEISECADNCVKTNDGVGCEVCSCPGAANSLHMTIFNLIPIMTLMWLAN